MSDNITAAEASDCSSVVEVEGNQATTISIHPTGDYSESAMMKKLLEKMDEKMEEINRKTKREMDDMRRSLEVANKKFDSQEKKYRKDMENMEEIHHLLKNDIEEAKKKLTVQEVNYGTMLSETEVKIDFLQKELELVQNFQLAYTGLGGETYFYTDLEEVYDQMKLMYAGNDDKLIRLDNWYQQKVEQRATRVFLVMAAGAGVGAMAGGLLVHCSAITAITVFGVTLGATGLIVTGLVGGLIIVGAGLCTYAAIRRFGTRRRLRECTATKEPIREVGCEVLDETTNNPDCGGEIQRVDQKMLEPV